MKLEIVERGPNDFVIRVNGSDSFYFSNRERAEGFVEGAEWLIERHNL